jgi:phosphatidylinositol alpha-1,6-mannosyltransferase
MRISHNVAEQVVVLTPNLCGRDGISRLARLVTAAFDEATVLALHEPRAVTRVGTARVCGADGRTSRFVAAALRAAAMSDRQTRVIVTHLHLAPAALAFAARGASLTALLCGVEAWRPMTWLQRVALDRTARLIAISRFTRDGFQRANARFAGRDIDVCHLGVEPAAAGGLPAPEPPSALIVGRMASDERYKGHDPLLEIWSDVAAAVPGAVLRIVGDGDDRPRLEQKAAALGLGADVSFLGRLDDEALEREYQRCTAFVMPSRDEGFGFVFVEAMRAARPCVGSRGAATEIIADGETGLLVDPGDRMQLTQSIVRVLRDRAAAQAMGARGRLRFLDHFTEEQFRARFTALLPVAP